MLSEISIEKDLESEISILNRIIESFQIFSHSTSAYENEMKLILLEMKELKTSLEIPKQNDHYIDCVWSNPACQCGPDSCLCYFRYWSPKTFTKKIMKIMGIDYVLWSLEKVKYPRLDSTQQPMVPQTT